VFNDVNIDFIDPKTSTEAAFLPRIDFLPAGRMVEKKHNYFLPKINSMNTLFRSCLHYEER